MLYKIISLQGDLAKKTTVISYIHLEENGGIWSVESIHYKKIEIGFTSTIHNILQMPVTAFTDLSIEVSNKLVAEVQHFIEEYQLEHTIDFIAFAGLKINDAIYLGNAAAIAVGAALPVIGNFHEVLVIVKEDLDIYAMAKEYLQIDAMLSEENKNIALALLAVLRWREAYNIIHHHNGATKTHIVGSIWLGVEA
jgi:hypothetical protein